MTWSTFTGRFLPSPTSRWGYCGRSGSHGKPRVLYTHHSTLEFDTGLLASLGGAYTAAHRLLARLADHVVVTSEAYADAFGHDHDPPVSVVPWGVDAGRFQPATPSGYDGTRPLRVLFVGQLRPYKGAAVAIDAVAHQPRLSLTVVGRGSQELPLRRRLIDSGADNVRMTGYLDEEALVDAYRAHDVCVLPSTNRQEAFGLTLLEGMAAGCVPVASDLPGVRDVARSNGMLVAPGDVQDLRWALNTLAARPAVVARLQTRSDRGSYPPVVGSRVCGLPRPRRATCAVVRELRLQGGTGDPDRRRQAARTRTQDWA